MKGADKMIKHIKYTLLILTVGLSACGGSGDSNDSEVTKIQYSISLTEITLTKKGSGEVLTVSGLPAHSATLTQN